MIATRHGAAGMWTFAFGEERGNRFVIDDDGNYVQDIDYAPFGEPTSTGAQPGSAAYSNDQWNGGDALTTLGVSQLGARSTTGHRPVLEPRSIVDPANRDNDQPVCVRGQ